MRRGEERRGEKRREESYRSYEIASQVKSVHSIVNSISSLLYLYSIAPRCEASTDIGW